MSICITHRVTQLLMTRQSVLKHSRAYRSNESQTKSIDFWLQQILYQLWYADQMRIIIRSGLPNQHSQNLFWQIHFFYSSSCGIGRPSVILLILTTKRICPRSTFASSGTVQYKNIIKENWRNRISGNIFNSWRFSYSNESEATILSWILRRLI